MPGEFVSLNLEMADGGLRATLNRSDVPGTGSRRTGNVFELWPLVSAFVRGRLNLPNLHLHIHGAEVDPRLLDSVTPPSRIADACDPEFIPDAAQRWGLDQGDEPWLRMLRSSPDRKRRWQLEEVDGRFEFVERIDANDGAN